MEESIFKKLAESEKKSIFKAAVVAHLDFLVKGDKDQIYYLRSEKIEEDALIICSKYNNSPTPDDEKGILVSFVLDDERYYFQSDLRNMPSGIHIAMPNDLFILHRRKQVRVKIPASYQGVYNIIKLNDKVTFIDATILDYSSGGLKLIYNNKSPVFKIGDQLRGVLRLGTRNPFEIETIVRHIAPDSTEGKSLQVFGAQFTNITKLLETKLMTLTMDLHREILVKSKN